MRNFKMSWKNPLNTCSTTISVTYSETKITSQLEHRELIHKQHVEHFLMNYAWGNDSLMKSHALNYLS